jgi:predicted lipid carrier protein YhbT
MLVVDLLHEFELGVWKSLFTHLIRILHAAALHASLVAELDRRYVNCTVNYLELIFCFNQVSGRTDIWLKHNQAFCNECLRNEEACST